MTHVKPINCTCKYPEVIARNMNGHTPPCPVYVEWRSARAPETSKERRLAKKIQERIEEVLNGRKFVRIDALEDEIQEEIRNEWRQAILGALYEENVFG